MNQQNDKPGYAALRRFRSSAAEAEYFLTSNLSDRCASFGPDLTAELLRQWLALETDRLWKVRTALVMPDHVHLLVNLGAGGTLANCRRLFKGRLSPKLRAHGLQWQDGYYEHKMRESEDLLPVFLYIYLNPYRAGLIATDQTWPGYYCAPEDWNWFGDMTANAVPQPEWLK